MKKKPRSCLECKHWQFDAGYPDYSEVTPGEDWSMECCKLHFRLSGFDISEKEFRATMTRAGECTDFEAVE